MISKNKSKTQFFHITLFFLGSNSLPILLPPPTKQCSGMGNGGHGQLKMLPMGCSSSIIAPACTGYGPSGTDCTSVNPLQCHRSCKKICSYMNFSPLAMAPTRSLLQHGVSTGCSLLQVTSACSGVPSSTGCREDICSTMDLHRLQGVNLLHHGLHRGTTLLPGAPAAPPSSLTLCLQGHFSLVFLTLLSQILLHSRYVITKALAPLLIGSASASGRLVLKPAGIGSVIEESSNSFSQKPSQQSPRYQKLAM